MEEEKDDDGRRLDLGIIGWGRVVRIYTWRLIHILMRTRDYWGSGAPPDQVSSPSDGAGWGERIDHGIGVGMSRRIS